MHSSRMRPDRISGRLWGGGGCTPPVHTAPVSIPPARVLGGIHTPTRVHAGIHPPARTVGNNEVDHIELYRYS